MHILGKNDEYSTQKGMNEYINISILIKCICKYINLISFQIKIASI